jgi:hypothetical protein
MTKFTIKQEEITRLRVFEDHVGKFGSILPVSTKQLFNLPGADKLEIFALGEDGSASAIQGEIKIDIINVSIDTTVKSHFVTDLNALLIAITKLKNSDINFQLSDAEIIITGASKSVFNIKLLASREDSEVTEIRNYIDTQLALPEFVTNQINLDITNIKDDLLNLASLTKIFNLNQMITVSETSIKVADNFGIYAEALATKPIIGNTLDIHRDMTSLFKNINNILISADKKFWFFNFVAFGIRALIVQPTAPVAYPTSQEIADIIPASSKIKLEVNAKKFYEALEEFDGLFRENWTYSQMFFKTPSNFDSVKEFQLSYNDDFHQVTTQVPVNIIERTDTNADFEFIIPTKEIVAIEPLLNKDENSIFFIDYNSVAAVQPNGAGIRIYNDSGVELVVPKMNSI